MLSNAKKVICSNKYIYKLSFMHEGAFLVFYKKLTVKL